VEAGEDPICVYRDPSENQIIELPQEQEKFGSGAAFRKEFLESRQTRYSPLAGEIGPLFRRYGESVGRAR
jgi:5,5'-dehydrodivanillate O-demethylase